MTSPQSTTAPSLVHGQPSWGVSQTPAGLIPGLIPPFGSSAHEAITENAIAVKRPPKLALRVLTMVGKPQRPRLRDSRAFSREMQRFEQSFVGLAKFST